MRPCYLNDHDRVTDSMRRARTVDLMLRAAAAGEVVVDAQLLRALARCADRVAVDLAVVDRNLAVGAL